MRGRLDRLQFREHSGQLRQGSFALPIALCFALRRAVIRVSFCCQMLPAITTLTVAANASVRIITYGCGGLFDWRLLLLCRKPRERERERDSARKRERQRERDRQRERENARGPPHPTTGKQTYMRNTNTATHAYIYTRTHARAYIHARTHRHTSTHTHTHAHTRTHRHTRIHMHEQLVRE